MNALILETLFNKEKGISQRELASKLGISLGKVNEELRQLKNNGLINQNNNVTEKGKKVLEASHPQRAIILAAGYGMRMVPINMEEPKGLLEVNQEPLIERLIKQLHKVGVYEIHIVVGFMKEHYEYLIDKYDVGLIVNSHYSEYKNMYSLLLAKDYLANSYILPCDVWFKGNPFNRIENESYYLFSNQDVSNSIWRVQPRGSVKKTSAKQLGNRMVGLAYISYLDAISIMHFLDHAQINQELLHSFWETLLEQDKKFILKGKIISNGDFKEINSYEELRELDYNSNHLQNDAIKIIAETLEISPKKIKNIRVLKKGMTNRSFFFEHDSNKYIMRIPGKGTDELIDRQSEYDVYQTIKNMNWTEKVLYLNPDNGYKLSKFIKNSHNCDTNNSEQVQECMNLLRKLHHSVFKVNHRFDLYNQIDFYEGLRGNVSAYRDYDEVKERVKKLRPFIEKNAKKEVLCHIDANPDNFIFSKKHLYLIDWEYAGMQDPDIDIAMFAIYAMYDQQKIDKLIQFYYHNQCDSLTKQKIYAYIAACGLLWSNWCEYKQSLGLDFGAYSIAQYRYAKEYSKKVLNYLGE
ncbi:phosphotransferase [Limosilactobacillus sp. pH52_RY]|uniref:phosphotransferase n=1 Tax=Limosilactobacillus balticus TaxID=2759747 RepID=UPI0015F96CA4|nr:phosphotransferase [Limosilactobacillus balticus]MBB1109300.1 phosphotransferase [Limosilactobacillus balticus]